MFAHTRIKIAVWIALIGIGTLNADAPPAEPPQPPKPTENDAPDGPYLGRALAETISSNLLIWGWDRFVLGASWAEINPDTWKGNIEEGLVWDNSVFVTNQILHPYQGSLYFNSARSSGFSFWQSVPFTIGGSLMWEFFMEAHHPSFNDLITTSFGGVAFGEMSHRISSLLHDDPTTSDVRPGKRIAAAALDPVGSLNRMLYGQPAPVLIDGRRPPHTLSFILGTGVAASLEDDFSPVGPVMSTGIRFRYGDPYLQKNGYQPYDYFDVNMGFDVGPGAMSWDLFAHALLFGRKIYPGVDAKGLVGLFQYFDYLENPTYKFSANGVGPGLQISIPFSGGGNLELLLHLPGIALGVIDSEHSLRVEHKDYSMGPGAAVKTGLTFTNGRRLRLSLAYSKHWIETYSGADRRNIVGMVGSTIELALNDGISIGMGASSYDRWSDAKIDEERSYLTHVYLTRRQ